MNRKHSKKLVHWKLMIDYASAVIDLHREPDLYKCCILNMKVFDLSQKLMACSQTPSSVFGKNGKIDARRLKRHNRKQIQKSCGVLVCKTGPVLGEHQPVITINIK